MIHPSLVKVCDIGHADVCQFDWKTHGYFEMFNKRRIRSIFCLTNCVKVLLQWIDMFRFFTFMWHRTINRKTWTYTRLYFAERKWWAKIIVLTLLVVGFKNYVRPRPSCITVFRIIHGCRQKQFLHSGGMKTAIELLESEMKIFY